VQKITVADIKIKTGTGEKGPWTNTAIIDEKGARFSSFDKKLSQLNKGSVIEAEVVVDGKFLNIKEFKILEEAPASGEADTGASQMSKEDWAKKDAIERLSIEAQTAVKALIQLAGSPVTGLPAEAVEKALNWCINRIDRTMPPLPALSVKMKAKAEKEKPNEAWNELVTEPEEEPKSFIDMDWFRESLESIRAKKLTAWTESNLLGYMKTTYKVDAKTVLEAATKLDKGQATHLLNRIQETLGLI